MSDEEIQGLVESPNIEQICRQLLAQRDQYINLYCDTAKSPYAERLIEINNKAILDGV